MTLATSIQSELRRVGCYSGDVDGVWNERTRVAMRAFNTSVHVNLGIDKPDYILLTLLQGHSSKACSRSCDTAAANGGACIDKSIEARALPPATLATRTVAERSRGEARTSSVTVSAPIVLSKSPVSARTADSLGVAPVPAGRWVSETKVAVPVAPSTGSADSRATEAVAEKPPPVIPGRMAVGALPTPEARPGSGSATDISDARPVQRERSRPAPVATARSRPERSTPTRRSRLSRTFSELNHNSP